MLLYHYFVSVICLKKRTPRFPTTFYHLIPFCSIEVFPYEKSDYSKKQLFLFLQTSDEFYFYYICSENTLYSNLERSLHYFSISTNGGKNKAVISITY